VKEYEYKVKVASSAQDFENELISTARSGNFSQPMSPIQAMQVA
jgi:hypothetical protein